MSKFCCAGCVRSWHIAAFRWAAELGRYQSRADMDSTCSQLNSVANDPQPTSVAFQRPDKQVPKAFREV